MRRELSVARPDWQQKCNDVGFTFHSMDGYWNEKARYRFTSGEIDRIEQVTNELHGMCIDLITDVIERGDYEGFNLPDHAKHLIEASWNSDCRSLYGRFDLAFRDGQLKMFEYNADTPTSLLEAAVVQWNWLQDMKLPDQLNSIHDKLVARWKYLAKDFRLGTQLFLTAMKTQSPEDWANVNYLMNTALESGVWPTVSVIELETIGIAEDETKFLDNKGNPIEACFKLYPWEWMLEDEFSQHLINADTRWFEPEWKMLLSHKAILPMLWQKHQGHPNLLEAVALKDNCFIHVPTNGEWVVKPALAREGANTTIFKDGMPVAAGIDYNEEYDKQYVAQRCFDLPCFDGMYPVIGSWIIGEEAAGIGIRESKTLVTGNTSSFVPHYFD